MACSKAWSRAFFFAANFAQVQRLAEPAFARLTGEQNDFALGFERHGRHGIKVVDEADAADGRGRQNGTSVGFVVERDVAGDDGIVEDLAGFADAFDSLDDLAHDFGLLRIAEVEIVGDRQRTATGGCDVAPSFGDGLLAALDRVGEHVARRAVGGDGKAAV